MSMGESRFSASKSLGFCHSSCLSPASSHLSSRQTLRFARKTK